MGSSQELSLADGLAGQLLARLLVSGETRGAKLTASKHLAQGVEVCDILRS